MSTVITESRTLTHVFMESKPTEVSSIFPWQPLNIVIDRNNCPEHFLHNAVDLPKGTFKIPFDRAVLNLPEESGWQSSILNGLQQIDGFAKEMNLLLGENTTRLLIPQWFELTKNYFRISRIMDNWRHIYSESQLFMEILHGLRTPQTIIQGGVELYANQLTPQQCQEITALIINGCYRLSAGIELYKKLLTNLSGDKPIHYIGLDEELELIPQLADQGFIRYHKQNDLKKIIVPYGVLSWALWELSANATSIALDQRKILQESGFACFIKPVFLSRSNKYGLSVTVIDELGGYPDAKMTRAGFKRKVTTRNGGSGKGFNIVHQVIASLGGGDLVVAGNLLDARNSFQPYGSYLTATFLLDKFD